MTFRELQISLDATLISYRARILHNQGLAPKSIADTLNISTKRVKGYLKGVYCTAKTPKLPTHICQEASKIWRIPVLRYSGSKARLRLNSKFHHDAYIPGGNK